MKQQGNTWTDPNEVAIQFSRVTILERWEENNATRLLTKAKRVESNLIDLHNYMKDIAERAFEKYKERNPETTKSGHTWYNFDHTIKIVTDVQTQYTFDEDKLKEIEEKFMDFIKGFDSESEEVALLTSMVTAAFKKSGGKVEVARLDKLIRYEKEIKNTDFKQMIALLKKVKKKDGVKVYFRIWEKEDGEFRQIQLNFSSITL